ncbi:TetR/AcrR family transcriptional regulator [Ornithinicoccus hortensis]|uniref:TetR family transcriptional regulator n=1 Tax=Ornithinicoccus hortensis TaxID=82346 RepID=A0A542YUE1_9MICO|nr:TetR/AcrR family transcriptional regulator [Ornithinicoccus hortensis]TQL51702.1 TetR family transcriptional regulator [Ornithinicoccus hortensis]
MVDKTDSGLPRAVAIAWGTHVQPQSGPRRGLTHEKIVARAIEIADEHGLSAVTMQRLAESLGFTTMSLYRYVANKDELFLLMIGSESLLPERRPVAHEDWRVGLRAWADTLRQMYRAHPWILEITRGPTSVLLPASVVIVDEGLAAVRSLPLTDQDKISLILAVSSYISAFATLERDLAGQEELEFGPEAMAELGEVITAERLPFAGPLFLSGGYVGGPLDEESAGIESEYDFGLDLLIRGLAARFDAGDQSSTTSS